MKLSAALVLPFFLVQCASTEYNGPSGSTNSAQLRTPPHKMSKSEYPFDDAGNYRKDWVKKGGSSSSYKAPTKTASYSAPKPTYKAPSTSNTYRPPSAPAPKPKPAARYHSVSKGDTLYSISKRYGTSVSALKSTNGLSGDLIKLGQSLRIP